MSQEQKLRFSIKPAYAFGEAQALEKGGQGSKLRRTESYQPGYREDALTNQRPVLEAQIPQPCVWPATERDQLPLTEREAEQAGQPLGHKPESPYMACAPPQCCQLFLRLAHMPSPQEQADLTPQRCLGHKCLRHGCLGHRRLGHGGEA